MTTEKILNLSDERNTLELAGGKGASLARLSAAGLPVPGGFVVTTEAYREFVDKNGLQDEVLAALAAVDLASPTGLEEASRRIQAAFMAATIPPDLTAAIGEAYEGIGAPAVAVRSSATAEDLPEASFAGQQDTYLNVQGAEAVIEATRRCWASLWTARAIGYRAQHGIDPNTVRLAVVVQEMVPAEAAGILFTANPVNGRRDQAVINAAWGLGEAIVGGHVTPDTLVVDRSSGKIVSRETPEKAVMTVQTATGTEEQPVPADRRRAAVLDDASALELVRLSERIERLYGVPMDIEWARADGRFTILQARPITVLPPAPAAPIEWKLPRPKGKYARASIIELMPDPLTPLFATMGVAEINRGYVRLIRGIKPSATWPENFVTLINDYAYYDMAFSARQLLLLFGITLPLLKYLGTAESRWRDEGRPRYAAVVARWEAQALASLPARTLLQGVREILTAAVDHYIVNIQAGILPAAYMSEALFTLFYQRLVRRADDPPALTFMLGFDSLPIRAEKSLFDLAQWCRRQPDLAEALQTSSAVQIAARLQNGEAPAGVAPEVWSEFRDRFTDHLASFGHAIYNLDFAFPLAADDPVPLIETLKHLVQGQGSDPYRRQQEAAQRRLDAERRVESRLKGLRRKWFRRLLDVAQRYAPLREEALGDTGLGWPLLRRMLLELGRRLVEAGAIIQPDDVFWLTETEVDRLAAALDAGTGDLGDMSETISERKARIEAEKRHTPPPLLPEKSRFAGFDLEAFMPARTGEQAGDRIQGVAASPGKVTAPARVLRGPEDFAQMQEGEVLVAAITTPAWTPLFVLASAVVTDVGGPLSHSSIVAREYGIPAVLGTGVATRRIRSGQTLIVDGTNGVVTLLDGPANGPGA